LTQKFDTCQNIHLSKFDTCQNIHLSKLSMASFHIILTSQSSSELFSENNPNRFTTVFPRRIKLIDSKWKIALQSLCIGTNFSNVPKDILTSGVPNILIWLRDDYEESKPPSYKISIENKFFSLEHLAKHLQEKTNKLEEGHIIPSVSYELRRDREDKQYLDIRRNFCTIGIEKHFCEWIGIDEPLVEISAAVNSQANIFSIYRKDYFIFSEDMAIISSSKRNLGEAIEPKMIKIEISDLSKTLTGCGYSQYLSIIPYENKLQETFHHVVKRKEYFGLKSSELESLSIRLVDENNSTISILGEDQSFLHLIVKKMRHPSFMMRLSSSDCKNLFPENTRSNFRLQLAEELDFTRGQWEVALTSMKFNSTIDFDDVITKDNFWIEFVTINGWDVNTRISFDTETITDLKSFRDIINRKIEDVLPKQFGEKVFTLDYTFDKKASLNINRPMRFKLSNLFSYVIGMDSRKNEEIVINNPGKIYSTREVNLGRGKPNVIFLHCDFISPTIVGDKYMKVLKMLPLHNSKSFECEHLDFMNITANNLSTIQIQLTDEKGKNIVFSKNNNDDVLINLVFQQKRK